MGVRPTVAIVLERLEDRGLDPYLIQQIKSNVKLPKQPAQPVLNVQEAVADFKAVLPSRTILNVRNEHKATLGRLKSLRAWSRAFAVVQVKHPAVWAVLTHSLRLVQLDFNSSDTADASWSRHLSVNLTETPRSYVGTLVHETGHMFEDAQSDKQEIAGWKRLYGNPPFSHNYFEDRAVEDFAECFRQYHMEPAKLKRSAPMKFEDIALRMRG